MSLFSKALRFGCNQCGECCRQVQVPLSHADVLRLSERFKGQPLTQWLQLHPIEPNHPEAVWIEARPVLLTLRTRLPEGGCRMLVENRCSIYADRPGVCRSFPFARRGRELRIAPEFELLVELACDKTPFHGEREIRQYMDETDRDFARFRQLTRLWNAETANRPEAQTLIGMIEFFRSMEVAV